VSSHTRESEKEGEKQTAAHPDQLLQLLAPRIRVRNRRAALHAQLALRQQLRGGRVRARAGVRRQRG